MFGISACNLSPDDVVTKTYVLEFGAQGPGGKIICNDYQIVKEGENSKKVVAVADNGYYFTGWADLVEVNTDQSIWQGERIIENVKEDRVYIALFEKST